MALVQRSPPPDPHVLSAEVMPDIVFIISPNASGTSPLGYFCSRSSAAAPAAGPWLVFPENRDTWVWLTVAQGTQPSDTAWPDTFYLVAAPTLGFNPPAPANGSTYAYYTSGAWDSSTTGATSTTGPTYLFSLPGPSNTTSPLGYVQLSGTTRKWFKSGGIGPLENLKVTTWTGTEIAMPAPPLGQWILFQSVAASQTGTEKRFLLSTTQV